MKLVRIKIGSLVTSNMTSYKYKEKRKNESFVVSNKSSLTNRFCCFGNDLDYDAHVFVDKKDIIDVFHVSKTMFYLIRNRDCIFMRENERIENCRIFKRDMDMEKIIINICNKNNINVLFESIYIKRNRFNVKTCFGVRGSNVDLILDL